MANMDCLSTFSSCLLFVFVFVWVFLGGGGGGGGCLVFQVSNKRGFLHSDKFKDYVRCMFVCSVLTAKCDAATTATANPAQPGH